MRHAVHAAVVVGAILVTGAVVGSQSVTTTADPSKAEIVTADVDHFWRAFDAAAKAPAAQRADIYRQEYFDTATQGLQDYARFRHVTAASLAAQVEQNRDEYARLRPYINQVTGQKPVIQSAFRRLKALYPDMKFPAHVYFIVGPQRGAGMNSPNGIILAADMFATPPGTPYSYTRVSPAYVPFSAVHETIHFNQAYETTDKSTLLQQVINEGTADFITTLVLPQPDVRQMTDRWKYGCPREPALDERFLKDADRVETSPWMFDHNPATGWPPDMGYWLGYRIAQTYHASAADKTASLRALLEVTDFPALLAASHYPANAPACAPASPARP
jgi:hypothetical protein